MDLKSTLNLPSTAFGMKANLGRREPEMLEFWDRIDIYGKIRALRAGAPAYVLHDGPPYANGNIHMGTAINKILKDVIIKSRTMMGLDAPYLPGWDCHGLPIEIKVDQMLGARKARMSKVDIRRQCRQYAAKFIDLQRKSFQRLEVFGEWNNPYSTMSYSYEAEIARAFGDFVGKGMVYRGHRPVHWCYSCKTALAEAEVEYEDHQSPSIYVAFPLVSGLGDLSPRLAGRDWSVLIWTTTPWTLPANLAIAFHPEHEYSAVVVGGKGYILATDLVQAVADKCGWGKWQEFSRFKGGALERRLARHPFIDRESLLVLGEYVTLDAGTGCVHTAPGHGYDDYVSGIKYGLEVLCPVDDDGRFTPEVAHFGGLHVLEANDRIVRHLGETGWLLHSEAFQHTYPHCWRCHNPILFRATPQWFISLDTNGYREKVLEAIRSVRWIPSWGEGRISNMVKDRPDWCISRQRDWGVPIIAFHCAACGNLLLDKNVIYHVASIFEQEGADAWYARDASGLLPDGSSCPKCGGMEFSKEYDILDVWFDSGSSHLAALGRRKDLPWPADLYIEGGDQYRGWFQSSLLIGVGLRGESPYRASITHGWTLDEQGRAMSKSKGIGIEPADLIRDRGAEIARLLAASVNYVEDIRIFDQLLDRLEEAYRKIRNTCRFLLGNLSNRQDAGHPRFDPARDAVPYERMLEIDRWALARTAQLIQKCLRAYGDYQFHMVYHAVYNFCTVDLSSFYLDVLKDRLYTHGTHSISRRSAQTALWQILDALVRLLAPILPFTAEEAFQAMYEGLDSGKRPESVHMLLFPVYQDSHADPALLQEWDEILSLREVVLRALEEVRQQGVIGNALEARVVIRAGSEKARVLEHRAAELRYIFIVSQAALAVDAGLGPEEIRVEVAAAEGEKCERCWNYSPQVRRDADFPTLCERCAPVVREMRRADPMDSAQ